MNAKKRNVLAQWIKSWKGIQKEVSEREYREIVFLINKILGRSYNEPRLIPLDTGDEEITLRIIPLKGKKYLIKVE